MDFKKKEKMRDLRSLLSCESRIALVTGAAGYLGRTISKTLSEIGYDLILIDLDLDDLNKVALEIKETHKVKITTLKCNLENVEERKNLIKEISKNFSKINCLINNAAFVGTTSLEGWNVAFEKQSLDSWKRSFEVNLTAPFHLVQNLIPLMKNSENPNIINVGSIYAHYAPDWNLYKDTEINNIAAYASAKAGLIQLTKWLSTTLAPDIRVNAISPGGILRNQNKFFINKYSSKVPLGRMAIEEDFIGAFAFLASDMSLYMTGQTLKVDGGWAIS
tara:strand:- start:504 stop:1331 length:828 start_codon:yes stop_codon:yes gene_type:complete